MEMLEYGDRDAMRNAEHPAGRTRAYRASGLVGTGREDAELCTVTMGIRSCGDLFQQRHIKHGFLLLLSLKPPT
jgi:hypothetical protein